MESGPLSLDPCIAKLIVQADASRDPIPDPAPRDGRELQFERQATGTFSTILSLAIDRLAILSGVATSRCSISVYEEPTQYLFCFVQIDRWTIVNKPFVNW